MCINKLGGCVVLYNPSMDVCQNVLTYLPFLEYLVVADNSDKKSEDLVDALRSLDRVVYLDMHGNKGIAAALNKGLAYLGEMNCEYALTMDQDSRFPIEDIEQIKTALEKYCVHYSVLGLNFNQPFTDKTDDIKDVNCWITSGNFVNLEAFRAVGGFNEDLFIDYVDIEFDYKIRKCGGKIGYLKYYSLIHGIGNPIPIHVLGKTFYSMNHSPVRQYYRYRNSRFLCGTDLGFFGKYYLKEILVNIPKMLIFEKTDKKKLE